MHDQDQPSDGLKTSAQNRVVEPIIITREHPLNQIVGDLRSGIQTRSRLAYFVSIIKFYHCWMENR
jgi:hypothetical protein